MGGDVDDVFLLTRHAMAQFMAVFAGLSISASTLDRRRSSVEPLRMLEPTAPSSLDMLSKELEMVWRVEATVTVPLRTRRGPPPPKLRLPAPADSCGPESLPVGR